MKLWQKNFRPYIREDLKAEIGRLFSYAGEIPVWAATYSVSFSLWPCLVSALFGGLCSWPLHFRPPPRAS